MIRGRTLSKEEIKEIWTIDRSEVIHKVYHFENGGLSLKQEFYDIKGWSQETIKEFTPHLTACFDRGGWFWGLFENTQMIGVVVLDNKFIGPNKDQLQFKFLHISRAYQGKGLGKELFELAIKEAQNRGAKGLYISSAPSENTVTFYLNRGCTLVPKPDPELYTLEPEDIHLEFIII